MKALISAATLFCLMMFTSSQVSAQEAGTIRVNFSNRTDTTITFFLNGGQGLETRLRAGQSSAYTMRVDENVPPTVTIHQPSGGAARNFSVANGGRYAFRLRNNVVVNTFDE